MRLALRFQVAPRQIAAPAKKKRFENQPEFRPVVMGVSGRSQLRITDAISLPNVTSKIMTRAKPAIVRSMYRVRTGTYRYVLNLKTLFVYNRSRFQMP
jgi:hypothetical protein